MSIAVVLAVLAQLLPPPAGKAILLALLADHPAAQAPAPVPGCDCGIPANPRGPR